MKDLTAKIEDICYKLMADYCGDTEITTDQATQSLTTLFKEYAESLIPKMKEFPFIGFDSDYQYGERNGFNSCREEIIKRLNP
jgi:hypothetical protein